MCSIVGAGVVMSASLFQMRRLMSASLLSICYGRHSTAASTSSVPGRETRRGRTVVMTRIAVCRRGAFCYSATPAVAQEQRASIEGTVRDASGGVLPGVTVEARSPSLVGVQTTVTDTQGGYRFPALSPGQYEIARISGIRALRCVRCTARAGQSAQDRMHSRCRRLACRRPSRSAASPPLIDVKQNAAGANIQAETIERIPRARNFTGLVTSAPGVTDESRNRGIQIDGASGATIAS